MTQWIKFLKFEFRLEFRNLYQSLSLLLYVVAAVYLINLSFAAITEVSVYNAVFWLVVLFASFNTAAGSFNRYSEGYQLFLFAHLKPQDIFLSRLIFNVITSVAVSLTGLILYNLFIGGSIWQNANQLGFIGSTILGSAAFGSALTFIAGISAKAGGNSGTLAVMGFPVLLPVILVNMKLSLKTLNSEVFINFLPESLAVLLLITLCSVLGYVLFPYLWRE
jgi:heme exporter protein B